MKRRRSKPTTIYAKPSSCLMCIKPTDKCHYGVPSCRKCMNFFRRNIIKERELHCEKIAECSEPLEYWSDPVVAQRPVKCSWCRLSRFVSLGMNPYAVELRNGKDLLEFPNVIKLFDVIRDHCGPLSLGIAGAHRSLSISPLNADLEIILSRAIKCNSKHRQLRTSEFNPRPGNRSEWGLSEFLRQPELFWVKNEPAPSLVASNTEVDGDDDSASCVDNSAKRTVVPLVALQKKWEFVDTICSIEYVKFFNYTFALDLGMEDQVGSRVRYPSNCLFISHTIFTNIPAAVIRASAIQINLLEVHYFSWSAGFDRQTFPDGTRKSTKSYQTNFNSEELFAKVAALSLSRIELSIIKALLVCKSDQITTGARKAFDDLTERLSKASRILTRLISCKYGETAGIARMTAIVDLFHALEVQTSRVRQLYVIEHLGMSETKWMRHIYI